MATKSLGTLTLDLIAKIGGFTGPMDKAARDAEKNAKKMAKAAKEAREQWISFGKASLAALVGLAGVGFARFIKETKEAEQEQAQLAAVLRSTGEAAGFSQGVLNEMADTLEAISTFSGGEITEAQTALLAFTGIVGNEFARALEAATNMATRTGVSVVQAAETIGRALDVPSKGMAALSKQGFRFSEDQKKVVAQLEATGRTAEAQGIILGALEESYGGAAEAARDTFGGSLSALNNTISALLTGSDGSLAGATQAVNDFNDTLRNPEVKAGIDAVATGIAFIASEAFKAVGSIGSLSSEFNQFINGLDVGSLSEVQKEIEDVESKLNNAFLFALDPRNKLKTSVAFKDSDELKEYLKSLKDIESTLKDVQKSSSDPFAAVNASLDSLIEKSGLFSGMDAVSILDETAILAQAEAIKAAEEAQKELNKAYDSQLEKFKEQIALTGDATELEQVRYAITQGNLVGINEEQQKRLEGLAAEIDQLNLLAESEKEIAQLREQLIELNDAALESEGKLIELENLRYTRAKEALEEQMELLREKGAVTLELEAEFQEAIEDQETAHQGRLKDIRDEAAADDLKRRQIQLAGAEELFGSLGDLADAFGKRSSTLRKAFLIGEKAAAIASATIAINEGIAKAAGEKFPQNLIAMGSVISATAGIVGNIEGVNIAHGGLDNVPKEQTYLLDAGERVVSPRQNADLTNFLSKADSGGGFGGMRIEVINNTGTGAFNASAMLNGDTLKIILTAVDTKLRQDLNAGRGVWNDGQRRYGWSTRGAV